MRRCEHDGAAADHRGGPPPASPPAVQPGHGTASPASRRRARKPGRAARRPSANGNYRGGAEHHPGHTEFSLGIVNVPDDPGWIAGLLVGHRLTRVVTL